MLKLTHWCMSHRRQVVAGWVAIAVLGDQRTIKEFGFGLAAAVFLDALIIRCVMLPAVLELLGPSTWRLPRWLDARLPRINIEGAGARALAEADEIELDDADESELARA